MGAFVWVRMCFVLQIVFMTISLSYHVRISYLEQAFVLKGVDTKIWVAGLEHHVAELLYVHSEPCNVP